MANQGYGNYETDAPTKPAPGPGVAPNKRPEANNKPEDGKPLPAAGPHADPALTNHAATPGAGALADGEAPGGDVDPGAG